MDENQFPRLDKSVFSVVSSFEEADEQDEQYWRSRTPIDRLQHMELLRRINYGDAALAPIQKIVESCERVGNEVKVIKVIDLENKTGT